MGKQVNVIGHVSRTKIDDNQSSTLPKYFKRQETEIVVVHIDSLKKISCQAEFDARILMVSSFQLHCL